MKKLILLLMILLVLGGGAAAVWWFFLKPKDEVVEVAAPPPPVLTQIDLPLTSISIINGNKSTSRIDFLIVVVFDDLEKQKKVEEGMPLLFDAINTELHSILPRKIVEQGGFQRPYLEQRLAKAVAARFGEGIIHQIYIKDMQVYK